LTANASIRHLSIRLSIVKRCEDSSPEDFNFPFSWTMGGTVSNGFMRRRIRAVALAAAAVWSMAANASAQTGIPKQVGALQNAVAR
jgi:hypothetical protein